MGRGSSKVGRGALSASEMYSKASESYKVDYTPYKRGQISKIDAGQVYKAAKNGDIKVKPELTKQLYDETKDYILYAGQRYTQNSQYYDSVNHLTHSLLNKDYKTAQALVDEIQERAISRSDKKSRWFKYKKGR